MDHIAAGASRQPRIKKPSIVEVLSSYTNLRRQGREYLGICPLHREKTASFYVNEEKGVAHCFGCQWSGDVIAFVMAMEGMNFKEALAHLSLTDQPRPTQEEIRKWRRVKEKAEILTAWALNMGDKIGAKMRELGQRGQMVRDVLREVGIADKEFLQEKADRIRREWTIMETIDQDFMNPAYVMELWQAREAIANIANDAGTDTAEKLGGDPPLTREYRERLQAFVRGEA